MGNIPRALLYHLAVEFQSRRHPPVKEALRLLHCGERASAAQLGAQRDHAFANLVDHAYQNVPYYRRIMDERGIRPEDIRSLDGLNRFPKLTKEIIRAEGNSLRARGVTADNSLVRRSGGTTGEPIASYVSPLARALETYSLLRGWRWMGWKPGINMVQLFGGTLGRPAETSLSQRLKNAALGTVFLPAFDLNEANAAEYYKLIRRAGPCVLLGYASALFNLACYAENSFTPGLRVQQVFSTAEVLPRDWSQRISQVFGCPVKSYYGFGEINSVGFQIDEEGAYLVPDEHVVVEQESSGSEHSSEESSGLLVTALYNYAQPLIRYEVGDQGLVLSPGSRHASRSVIEQLDGRTSDMFIHENGSSVSSSLGPHIVFVTSLPVKRYQFIQWGARDVEFRYESEGDVSDAQLAEVTRILQDRLGPTLQVRCHPADEFILSPQGKHRIMVRMCGN